MQLMLSVQSTPDPASPPGSRSVPGHDPATAALKRLNSPVSVFDALDESPPRVPPKTIREFRRKWSFGGGHSGGVRRLLRLSEREEPGKAGMLATSSPDLRRAESKTERAASTLCAAARGRSVRRELALVHATATYLQSRVLLHLHECRRKAFKRTDSFHKHEVALRAPCSLLQYRCDAQVVHLSQVGSAGGAPTCRPSRPHRPALEALLESLLRCLPKVPAQGGPDSAAPYGGGGRGGGGVLGLLGLSTGFSSCSSDCSESDDELSDISGKPRSYQETFSYFKGKHYIHHLSPSLSSRATAPSLE